MKPGHSITAYLLLSAAMIVVGSSVPAGKVIVAEMPVFLASALRYGIAAVILVPLYVAREGVPGLPSWHDGKILIVQAMCGTLLFSILLLAGLSRTSGAEGGVVTGIMPATTALLAFVLLRERLSLRRGLGIALAVIGMVILNLGGNGPDWTGSLVGNVLIMGATLCESLFIIAGKLLRQPRSALFISSVMSVLGFLMFLPVGLYQIQFIDLAKVSSLAWGTVLYHGAGVTVGGFLLWFAGVARTDASIAGIFTALVPLSAVTLSYGLLDEPMHMSHFFGGATILLAIVATAWKTSGNCSVSISFKNNQLKKSK